MSEKSIKLYKYLPCDQGSCCVLTKGTIKYTCPLEFNDPFDCRPSYSENALDKIHNTRPDLVKEIARQRGLSPAQRVQQKKKISKQIKKHMTGDSHLENILSGVGVVSLSEKADSVLMWSHYAKFHTGFVVEFEIPLIGTQKEAEEGAKNLLPFPIEYKSDRPEIAYGIDSDHDVMQKLIFSKSDIWAYEREQRVYDHKRGPGIHPYNRDKLLRSVIAGMKMDSDNYNNINAIINTLNEKNGTSIQLYKAEPCKKTYAVRVPNHPDWGEGF